MKCKACDGLLTDTENERLCVVCLKEDREAGLDNFESSIGEYESLTNQLDLITDINESDYLPLE